jgi:hypothetical protein
MCVGILRTDNLNDDPGAENSLAGARLSRWVGTAVFLLIASVTGHAAEPESWQRTPSEDQIRGLLNLPAVPKADIYEVVPTKIETALVWHLAKVPFAVLIPLP